MSGRGAPRAPLSVCVLACNEERALERCLASVAWAEEIVVVVDAKSRDGSEEVAKRLASRVETRPYAGDVEQKRYAVSLARHDWVFILDPDEVVTPELGAAMQAALERAAAPSSQGSPDPSGTPRASGASAPPDAYQVNRATWHLGRWIRHGDFYPDWKLRLFRRSRARFVGRDPHGRVEVDGKVSKLEGELLHYSYRDLADQIARIQFFSGEAAMALVREGARFRLHQLVLNPPARFLRSYVLRAGFRDGLPGFVIAVASAFYVFLKYAKLWEARRVAAVAPATPPRIPPGTPRA
jgi:glycosyltransferase involved in cell wall biosynthesis